METRKEIDNLLNRLKQAGINRDVIEKDLNYSKNYIDQTLSKGGNKRFLNSLKAYTDKKLQNATSASNYKETAGTIILDASTVTITLQDYIDQMQQHNDFLQKIINSGFVDVKNSILDVKSNLKEIKEDLELVSLSQRADHSAILGSLERHLEKEPGKLAKEARNAKDAYLKNAKQAGKISNIDM